MIADADGLFDGGVCFISVGICSSFLPKKPQNSSVTVYAMLHLCRTPMKSEIFSFENTVFTGPLKDNDVKLQPEPGRDSTGCVRSVFLFS